MVVVIFTYILLINRKMAATAPELNTSVWQDREIRFDVHPK